MCFEKFALAAAVTAALVMPAFAQGAKPAAGMKLVSTKTFIKEAGETNLFEIQAGQLAEQKSDNSQVQEYAKMIVSDHQEAQQALKTAAKDAPGASVPGTLDKAHQKLIKQLKSTSGAKFLKTFKTQQVKGHKQSIQLFQNYAKGAQDQNLKKFAHNTVPVLKKHLQHAQNLPTTPSAPTVASGDQSNGGMRGGVNSQNGQMNK